MFNHTFNLKGLPCSSTEFWCSWVLFEMEGWFKSHTAQYLFIAQRITILQVINVRFMLAFIMTSWWMLSKSDTKCIVWINFKHWQYFMISLVIVVLVVHYEDWLLHRNLGYFIYHEQSNLTCAKNMWIFIYITSSVLVLECWNYWNVCVFYFFWRYWVWTQGLTLALYSALFALQSYFLNMVSHFPSTQSTLQFSYW
jgi:hypothetical protein